MTDLYVTGTELNRSNRSQRSSIRRSTNTDLDAVHEWLTEEEAQGVHGNFLCNWSLIERAHRHGELLVYIEGKTGRPLAFQLGGLIRPGILQVRFAHRGTGIGRRIVERCLVLAKKNDHSLLFIECKPSTSIRFWEKMGFTLVGNTEEKNYAYRVIEKPLPLPLQGVATAVVIRFFPEKRKWEPSTEPYAVYSPQAVHAKDGIVYLAERVQFHEEAFQNVRDVIVEIMVNGSSLFFDKAKYEKARTIGVIRCTNGYYIDLIREQSSSF